MKILNAKKGKSATNMYGGKMPNKITKEDFQISINNLFPDEEIKILDYSKASSSGKYRCNICGNIYQIYRMGDLTRKKHCCYNCFYGRGNGEKTKERKQKILEMISKDKNLEFISFGYNQKIYKTTVEFKCKKCGNNNSKQLIQFEQHPYCSYCSDKAKKMNTLGFQIKIPEEYMLLEEYKGSDVKILFRHNCGFIWRTTPHNIISGCGCPKCAKRRSKGEKRIINFLQLNKINFEEEKKFDWSNNKRYDFYLPTYNLVIEYMGIQHYKDIEFYGKHQLKEIQLNDLWKKEQALSNFLKYLEISYEDFENIESILAQRLNIKYPIQDKDIV